MLEIGASHNLVPKDIMESLGLNIIRHYSKIYSFDSKMVKCLGIIKDLVLMLTKLPTVSVINHFLTSPINIWENNLLIASS